MTRRSTRPPRDTPDARDASAGDALFDTVVETAMRTHGWSRARAEAMAATVVTKPGGRLRKAVAPRAPLSDARKRAFHAGRRAQARDTVTAPSPRVVTPAAPAKRPERKMRQLKVAHLRLPSRVAKTTLERAVLPDAGERRRGGRMFLQGGGPGLGRRR